MAAQLGRQGLQLVISVILARLLTPRDFGLFGMAVVFTGFASLLGEMGLTAALIQRKSLEERHLSSVFWFNISAGAVITSALWLFAPLIASLYREAQLTALTRLTAVRFLIDSLGVVQSSILSRSMRFRDLGIIEVTAVLASGAVAVFMAVLGLGVWSLAWQSVVVSVVSATGAWVATGWHPRPVFDRTSLGELLGFSTNLLGFNVFNYWARNGDNFLVGKFIGSEALGLYTRAYSMMLLPVTLVTGVLSRVMFPALSRIQDDIGRVKRIYLRSIAMIALVTFPMMMGLLVVSESFVVTLFGSKWLAMVDTLRILCLVGMFQSIVSTAGWIYQSQGRTDWFFRWGMMAGSLGLLSFAVGIAIGSIEAVAWCYGGLNALLLYPSFAIPGRLIGLTFRDVVRGLAGILACSVVMTALVWVSGLLLPSAWPDWARLAVQVVFGLAVYWGLVHVFDLEAYREVRELLEERVQSRFRTHSIS